MRRVRKIFTGVLLPLLLALPLAVIPASTAQADTCPTYNLDSIFGDEFYPWLKWDNSSGNLVITWSTNATVVYNSPVTRPFNAQEMGWLREAFKSWDDALSTISFQETDSPNAQVIVGLTAIQNSGYWHLTPVNNMRVSGTIQISSSTDFTSIRGGFIEVAQSEIGNLLGLGDITDGRDVDSVMKDPDTAPFGSVPLADLDIDLMRQFYGESTCHADWPAELKAAKASVSAEAQAKIDAETKAKQEEAAKAKADAEAKAKADAAAKAKAAAAKRSILCAKGRTVKKVTAVKPVCPKGFRKIA